MTNPTVLLLCMWLGQSVVVDADFDSGRLDNWHQWRGPQANGMAPHADPPVTWDEDTHVKWKRRIPGMGSSTPIVWGDRVFVLSAIKADRVAEQRPQAAPEAKTTPPLFYYRYLVLCIDRRTGAVRWQQTACEQVPHEGHHPTNTFASASPTTDGCSLYVSFGSRGVFCYDFHGRLQWKRDLGDMRTRFGWGEAASPVLAGERLVVNWDHEDDSFIVVLNTKTGETIWRAERDEPTSWATPLVVGHQGRVQVIANATNRVRSYDLDSGGLLWECGGQNTNTISSPVATGSTVVCMSCYERSTAFAIPLSVRGDITGTGQLVWSYDRGTPYVPSPLLYGKQLYFTQLTAAILTSLDAATGQVIIPRTRLPGLKNLYASAVGAAGRVYIVDREGTTLVIKHARQLEVLATNELNDQIDASPAIVGNQLFLRGTRSLYCIEAENHNATARPN